MSLDISREVHNTPIMVTGYIFENAVIVHESYGSRILPFASPTVRVSPGFAPRRMADLTLS